jgi:hypothetical protein
MDPEQKFPEQSIPQIFVGLKTTTKIIVSLATDGWMREVEIIIVGRIICHLTENIECMR